MKISTLAMAVLTLTASPVFANDGPIVAGQDFLFTSKPGEVICGISFDSAEGEVGLSNTDANEVPENEKLNITLHNSIEGGATLVQMVNNSVSVPLSNGDDALLLSSLYFNGNVETASVSESIKNITIGSEDGKELNLAMYTGTSMTELGAGEIIEGTTTLAVSCGFGE
ncbi:hypothetical protein [Vibrio splendidus]|uniref:hypothetical protein n=1 Tax=Vibrio splendidus TaxID=29497 RepID=UPI000D35479C|nr:hypothetical protein [Vibrio splendidus]PTP50623.1 hypothetical protein CWO05_19970 [Vibrio splendidus]